MKKIIKWWRAYYKFAISFVGYTSYILMIFIFFYFFTQKRDKEICRKKKERFNSWNYQGIVNNKFIDSTEHMASTLVLNNYKNIRLDSLLFNDIDLTYNIIEINDSLCKIKGSDTLWIFKEDKRLYFVFKECRK